MQKYSFNTYLYRWDPDPNGDCYRVSEVDAAMNEKDDRITELESALRLYLAVAPDDPVLITTAEKQIAALTAAMKEKDGLLWATEEANKDMRAEIAALQLYKDATLGKESERERQIITLKAEIAEIGGKLRGEQIRNRDIGEQMDTLTADNEQLKKEAVELHDKYGKLWDENSVLRKQNSAMNASLVELRPENERLREALKRLMRAYVLLFENGRERIIFLGGTCDSVEYMESNDPELRVAQDALKEPEVKV